MSKNVLSAGVARTVINPPLDADLCGYAGRIPGNIGVHDDLHTKVLVLSDGKTKAAIVSLDLIGLNAEQAAWIRQEASARTGIPRGKMLIGASHTHSGPALQGIRACGNPNESYVQDLLASIVDAVQAASRQMCPAQFGFGTAEANIAINRRYRAPSGDVQIGENPGGVRDPEVGIWKFTDGEGKPLATIFNCTCHAVVMGGDNRLVSADWPGAAQRAIESGIGGQAMFLQGCCGNINPRDRGTFELVEKTGAEAASATLTALSRIDLTSEAELDIRSEVVQLPLQPPPSVDDATRTANEMEEALAKADESTPLSQVHISQAYRDWARRIIAMGGRGLAFVAFEVQRFSLGDAHIIGLPGEVFVEYALELKQAGSKVMVSGYTNGNVGYVPTRKAFDEGGYEVDAAYKLYAEQMLSPEVEEMILSAGASLLNE